MLLNTILSIYVTGSFLNLLLVFGPIWKSAYPLLGKRLTIVVLLLTSWYLTFPIIRMHLNILRHYFYNNPHHHSWSEIARRLCN